MSSQQITEFINSNPWMVIVITLWTLYWKGTALWKAASKKQPSWFVIIMVLNTVGLLEIGYIYYLNKYELGGTKILDKIRSVFKK